jgi:hypothetical protein
MHTAGGILMHTDLVIDADGHCNELWEELTPWMPKEYHHRAPVGFPETSVYFQREEVAALRG